MPCFCPISIVYAIVVAAGKMFRVNSESHIAKTMTYDFEPFTTDAFRQQTGLNATDNEAVYIRWVNTQINYANYQQMQTMNASLKEITGLLKTHSW